MPTVFLTFLLYYHEFVMIGSGEARAGSDSEDFHGRSGPPKGIVCDAIVQRMRRLAGSQVSAVGSSPRNTAPVASPALARGRGRVQIGGQSDPGGRPWPAR